MSRSLVTARRAAAAVAIAALSAALFTGCVNPIEDLVNEGVEGAIEDATGGEVSLDGELPGDFPSEIPLVDGEIALGAGAGGADGWIVMITSTAADPVADAAAKLEGAGFAKNTELSGSGADALVYSNGTYLVLLAADGETVSYTVTPAP
ncbi:hypothetical protein [Agromyces italicus]|uniref:hypothetical protein n=1 Tax=Agromyces italicus TaxID=279572 RepID=UPI0003B4C421|nr:hypothetical protein [Agromyces italicus]